MRTHGWSWPGWTGILLCLGAGCGGADRPVRVQGKVTLDGQPVGGAAVQFVPESETARPAFAETQLDGTYTIMTKNPGDGAMPGDYRVVITWEPAPPPQFRTSEGGGASQERQRALEEYQAKQKKAGKGPTIPALYGDPGKTPLRVKVPTPSGRADFTLSSKP